MTSKKTLVVMLCMHRSGSSVTTSILQRLGMSLGPFELLGANASNPHGHYEAIPFLELNQQLQQMLVGFSEDAPQSTEMLRRYCRARGVVDSTMDVPERFTARARDLVAQLVDSGAVTGFKDPRTSLVWPVWKTVLAEFSDVRVVPLVILRSPHEIAMSVFTRSGGRCSYREALDVTAVHFERMQHILEEWPEACPVVRYGSARFTSDLQQAARACGLEWNADALLDLYRESSRHHHAAVVAHQSQDRYDELYGPLRSTLDPQENLGRLMEAAEQRESILRSEANKRQARCDELTRAFEQLRAEMDQLRSRPAERSGFRITEPMQAAAEPAEARAPEAAAAAQAPEPSPESPAPPDVPLTGFARHRERVLTILRLSRRYVERRGGWIRGSFRLLARTAAVCWQSGSPGLRTAARTFAHTTDGTAALPARPWEQGRLTEQQAFLFQSRFAVCPTVSLILPLATVPPHWFQRCLDSLLRQYYGRWELIVLVTTEVDPELEVMARSRSLQDPRVRLSVLPGDPDNVTAFNDGINAARGQWIGFLDGTEELTPDAFVWLVHAWNEDRGAQWLYSDEVVADLGGGSCEPRFKPDFSPEYLLSTMYPGRLSVYAADLLRSLGGLRSGFDGAEEHDLALRLSEAVVREQVVHVPRVLCVSLPCDQRLACVKRVDSGRRAVQDALERRGIRGTVTRHPDWPGLFQLKLMPRATPRVTVFISTRNAAPLVKRCVAAMRARTAYPNYEIVVIDNQSDDPELLAYLRNEQADGGLSVFRYDRPFNHSAMHNEAVRWFESDLIAFVNNDVEVLSDGWLEQMVATIQLSESIAGVGALLMYPDRCVQHAGIILGLFGGAGHAHKGCSVDEPGYMQRLHSLQELSGATAALLLLRRDAFLEVGGFRHERYPNSFNDVDLWIRLRQAGYRCLYNPEVQAIHDESRTRPLISQREMEHLRHLQADWWGELMADPFYNPNLALDNEQFVGFRQIPLVLPSEDRARRAA